MHCPFCRSTDTRVARLPGRRRRRARSAGAAPARRCEKRFTTVEQMQLTVIKRSGTTEPFTREKAIAGVRKACKGRPVSEDDLARLGQTVEDTLRGDGWAEVPAHEIGLAILGPLRELDEVAYLRFASVYRAFESADDFETEIAMLRMREATDRDQRRSSLSRPPPQPHRRADHRPPGVCSGEARAPGAPSIGGRHHHVSSTSRTAETTSRERGSMTETVSGAAGRAPQEGAEDRAGLLDRGRAPLRRAHLGAPRRRPDRTGRPARPSSSSAAWSSPTSGASTPPRSSPPSTSAAPSAPTSASGASSSSSTAS